MVPFNKLKAAVTAEQKWRDKLDLAESFIRKVFPEAYIGRIMQNIRATLNSNQDMELGVAVAACLPTTLPYDLYVTDKTASVHSLLVGDFRTTPLLKFALRSIGTSTADGRQAAVICKLNNMGTCVIHNVPLQSQSNPRIVIPASARGVSQIQVISLPFFVDDINGVRKKEGESK